MFSTRLTLRGAPILDTLKDKIIKSTPNIDKLKKSTKPVGTVTVNQVIGGMRGIPAMLTETSALDPEEGIRYRGYTLEECAKLLPKTQEIPLPEAAFWLLLTSEIPSQAEAQEFNAFLQAKKLPSHLESLILSFPADMHPMTQLASAVLAMQPQSKFAQQYTKGMRKAEYWEYCLEDALELVAHMPQIAATIYRKHFHKDMKMPKKPDMDWAGGFGQMLGVSKDPNFLEVLRLYLFLHADHEGGNVSAHTTHCVGSSLADPFLSWSAGLCGLAGPLHGLANQEALRWLSACREALGSQPITEERVMAFAEETLKAGKVIPGFGHAVLRKTDPRYMLQREFALKHMKDDPLFQLVDKCFTGIPKVLGKTGKVANPFPNVDAHSGQCLTYYNLHESDFYTVVFAVSRSLGVMSQLVNSRLLGLPIERPKSLNLSALEKL